MMYLPCKGVIGDNTGGAEGKSGFTVVELLVVILIITFSALVVVVSVNSARDKAKINSGKQFFSSVHNTIGLSIAGEWGFENVGTLNTAHDTSGYGSDGLLAGGAAQVDSSACGLGMGGCLRLGGVLGESVMVGDVDLGSSFTLSAWVYIPQSANSDNNPYVLAKRSSVQGYNIWLRKSGEVSYVDNSGVGKNTGMIIDRDMWQHILLAVEGTSLRAYKNGVQISEITVAIIPDNNVNLYIGARAGGSAAHHFEGFIDEVRIYSSALTAQEVGQLYAEGEGSHLFASNIIE